MAAPDLKVSPETAARDLEDAIYDIVSESTFEAGTVKDIRDQLVTWSVTYYQGEPAEDILLRDGKGNLPVCYIWAEQLEDREWMTQSLSVSFVVTLSFYASRQTDPKNSAQRARDAAMATWVLLKRCINEEPGASGGGDLDSVTNLISWFCGDERPGFSVTTDTVSDTERGAILQKAVLTITGSHTST